MNNTTTRPIAGIEMNDILSYLIVAILTICDLISINFEYSPHEELLYLSGNIDMLSISIEFGLWCYITTILYHRGTMPNWLRFCILGENAMFVVSTALYNLCNTFDMLGETNYEFEKVVIILGVVLIIYVLVVNALLARFFSGRMRTYAIVSIIFIVFEVFTAIIDDTDLVDNRFYLWTDCIGTLLYYFFYREMLEESALKQETVESNVEQL